MRRARDGLGQRRGSEGSDRDIDRGSIDSYRDRVQLVLEHHGTQEIGSYLCLSMQR